MRVPIDVLLDAVVGWRLGRGAAAQTLSFGTDWEAQAEHGAVTSKIGMRP